MDYYWSVFLTKKYLKDFLLEKNYGGFLMEKKYLWSDFYSKPNLKGFFDELFGKYC